MKNSLNRHILQVDKIAERWQRSREAIVLETQRRQAEHVGNIRHQAVEVKVGKLKDAQLIERREETRQRAAQQLHLVVDLGHSVGRKRNRRQAAFDATPAVLQRKKNQKKKKHTSDRQK